MVDKSLSGKVALITGGGQGVGQGIGLALAARGADIIFLDVAEDNVPAIALYRRAGFYQHGRRSGYYRRPQARIAALLFQKRLT